MSSRKIEESRKGIGSGLAFVVTGPSGAGKNSVIDRVMEELPGLAFSVSYTTRLPREGEIDRVDYIYVSREEFVRMIEEGDTRSSTYSSPPPPSTGSPSASGDGERRTRMRSKSGSASLNRN